MSGNQQFNFQQGHPPPLDPPPGGHPPSYPPQFDGGSSSRGGGAASRGRNGSRGNYGQSSYNAQASSFGPPPRTPNPHPAPYNGPHNPAPYVAQAPQGYAGQWQNDPNHQHAQQHQHHQQAQMHAPLSAQNYPPSIASQGFNQQPQYGQPPPQYQQSAPYGNMAPQQLPQSGPPPYQWTAPPQSTRQQYHGGARGRGRGGYNSHRGGHEAPIMLPPIRLGFANESSNQVAQVGNGFPPQTFADPQGPQQLAQPPYQGYPSQNYSQVGQRSALDPNPYYSNPYRGRGNFNYRGRGRGDFQSRGRSESRRQTNDTRSSSEIHNKSAGAEADARKKKKKRRTNTLGLTPNGVDHYESENEVDDVDEEARLVTLLGPDTPQLPDDLNAWLAERRARFPTKVRREAAEEELRKRREQSRDGKIKKESNDKHEGETKLERQQRKAEMLRSELKKAERKIQNELSGYKRKREPSSDDDDKSQVSNYDSDDSSSTDSKDIKPDTISSRHVALPHVPLPPKAQLQRHCKYFSTGGTCGKKGKCRFVHDQEVRDQALKDKEANGGKMTLAQRLILNDTAKDDLTILKSIKYLKEKGLMSEQSSASAPKKDEDNTDKFKDEENESAGHNFDDTWEDDV